MQGGRGAHVHMVEAVVAVHDHAAARSFRLQHHRAAAAHDHQFVEVQVHQLVHVVAIQEISAIADRVIGSVHHGLLAADLRECAAILVGDAGQEDPLLGHDLVGRCAAVVDYFDVVHLRPRVGCREGGLGTERQAGDQCHDSNVHLHGMKGICFVGLFEPDSGRKYSIL